MYVLRMPHDNLFEPVTHLPVTETENVDQNHEASIDIRKIYSWCRFSKYSTLTGQILTLNNP